MEGNSIVEAIKGVRKLAGEILSKKLNLCGVCERIIAYGILLMLSLITILPFFLMILIAFDGHSEWGWVPTSPPRIVPSPVTLRHFIYVFKAFNFGRYFFNSLVMTMGVTISHLVLGSIGGYAFGKLRFPGREIIFAILLGTLMVPPESIVVPRYLIVQKIGWLNSFYGLIVPNMITAFSIFMFRQFVQTISRSLEEAAIIDGCSWFGVYRKIILPLLKPALVSVTIITFVQGWNNFLWPLLVAQSEKMYTLQIGLSAFKSQSAAEWSPLMAGTAITIIPTMIIFIALQKYYVSGLTMGGVKG